MKEHQQMFKNILILILIIFNFNSLANAEDTKPVEQIAAPTTKKTSNDIAATVNGTTIPKSIIDEAVKAYVAQGQKDSLMLRQSILDNLINRQILSQEASKLNLDKSTAVKNQLELLKTNFLASLALNNRMEKNPIKDSDLKPEYDRQLKMLGNANDLYQYKISHVVFPSEVEAKEALDKIKKGESINQVALQNSANKNKDDGSLDWILPNQILPEISNVMVNLSKGTVCAAPIFSNGGWHIIKVDDKRTYKIPTFEESKNNIRAGLMQKKQAEYLIELRKSAKIQIQ